MVVFSDHWFLNIATIYLVDLGCTFTEFTKIIPIIFRVLFEKYTLSMFLIFDNEEKNLCLFISEKRIVFSDYFR